MCVVLATNRTSPFLTKALESVADQTVACDEVVVVDDGHPYPGLLSSQVLEILPRAKVVRSGLGNVSVARNIGIGSSTSELVAFIDDDDVWHPRHNELMSSAFARDSEAVAGYCGMLTIDRDDAALGGPDQVEVDIHTLIRRDAGIMLPNFMVRRRALQQIGGFNSAFRYAEDLDLILRVARLGEGRFVYVPDPLVSYRTHHGNVTRNVRALCESIRNVLKMHRSAAIDSGRADLVSDFNVSLRRNRRYAGWATNASWRRSGDHEWRDRVKEIAWLARFAPDLPFNVLAHRLGLIS